MMNMSCRVFFLGFSTGHVGTTTLSSRHSYVDGELLLRSFHFMFETARLHVTKKTTIADEEEFAKNYLARLRVSGRQRCVDLSHFWISFGRGLINVLRQNDIELHVVRIRRDSCEVAKSFAEARRGVEGIRCLALVGACALQAADPALPVDERGWLAWSPFQRALWMSDETEEQWRTRIEPMIEKNNVLEVEWSKSDDRFDDPLLAALIPISNYLGLRVSEEVPRLKEHVSEPVSSLERKGVWTSDETMQMLRYRHDLHERFDDYNINFDHLPSSKASCLV